MKNCPKNLPSGVGNIDFFEKFKNIEICDTYFWTTYDLFLKYIRSKKK